MSSMVDFTSRIRPDQKAEIAEVRELRNLASDLRSKVSQGSYQDEDLALFWKLIGSAGSVLRASNPQLGQRAGLGDTFFSSVTRNRRRPKLQNFLKALTVVIEVADERLFDVENPQTISEAASHPNQTVGNRRIAEDYAELLLLASSLGRLARGEIQRLDDERPNDAETIERNKNQRDLLAILATGFERISIALTELESNPTESLLLGKASEVVDSVANQVNIWWKDNGTEVVDWSMRIPVFVAGVAMLGWAGANMTIATSAVAAIVGGKKIINSIKKRAK